LFFTFKYNAQLVNREGWNHFLPATVIVVLLQCVIDWCKRRTSYCCVVWHHSMVMGCIGLTSAVGLSALRMSKLITSLTFYVIFAVRLFTA